MNYKLTFEIDYKSLSKQSTRDYKIEAIIKNKFNYSYDIVNSDKIPVQGSIVILDEKEYIVTNLKYKFEENSCTYVMCVIPIDDTINKKIDDIHRLANSQAFASQRSLYPPTSSIKSTKKFS